MKKIKFILFVLFTALMVSCSSDGDGDDSSQIPTSQAYFGLTYNNKAEKVNAWQAGKSGDFMEVMGVTEGGIAIDFKFNIYGNLYDASTYPASNLSSNPHLKAFESFTASSFTFTLENLNTIDKTVQVKFFGKVYKNEFDDTSEFVNVSGSFKLLYKETAPPVEGLGTYAKIDGKDWHGLSFGTSIQNWESKTVWVENDGEYTVGIVFPYGEAKTGTYTFSSNNNANRITFRKYDITTHREIVYDVAGTITYSTVNDTYVAGTFSLTATDPETKAKIVISNGTFKEGI